MPKPKNADFVCEFYSLNGMQMEYFGMAPPLLGETAFGNTIDAA